MNEIQYTSVDRILASLDRDLKNYDATESDIIEYIGEALSFLSMPEIQEETVSFITVKDFHACVPLGLKSILQVARYQGSIERDAEKYEVEDKEDCFDIEDFYEKLMGEESSDIETINSCGPLVEVLYNEFKETHDPLMDLHWSYDNWIKSTTFSKRFKPVRLGNSTLFNSIVCREIKQCDNYSEDEYTVVGTTEKRLRFSFCDGLIAVSHLRNAIDKETGYPLIPDVIQHVSAINYYIKWKLSESLLWNNREGAASLVDRFQALWLKYVKQAKNWTKMPKSIDQLQNLLEASHQMIPNHKRYYKFFGNLGREDQRQFANPDNRLRFKK